MIKPALNVTTRCWLNDELQVEQLPTAFVPKLTQSKSDASHLVGTIERHKAKYWTSKDARLVINTDYL